jgi:hypothetical protein
MDTQTGNQFGSFVDARNAVKNYRTEKVQVLQDKLKLDGNSAGIMREKTMVWERISSELLSAKRRLTFASALGLGTFDAGRLLVQRKYEALLAQERLAWADVEAFVGEFSRNNGAFEFERDI